MMIITLITIRKKLLTIITIITLITIRIEVPKFMSNDSRTYRISNSIINIYIGRNTYLNIIKYILEFNYY